MRMHKSCRSVHGDYVLHAGMNLRIALSSVVVVEASSARPHTQPALDTIVDTWFCPMADWLNQQTARACWSLQIHRTRATNKLLKCLGKCFGRRAPPVTFTLVTAGSSLDTRRRVSRIRSPTGRRDGWLAFLQALSTHRGPPASRTHQAARAVRRGGRPVAGTGSPRHRSYVKQ